MSGYLGLEATGHSKSGQKSAGQSRDKNQLDSPGTKTCGTVPGQKPAELSQYKNLRDRPGKNAVEHEIPTFSPGKVPCS